MRAKIVKSIFLLLIVFASQSQVFAGEVPEQVAPVESMVIYGVEIQIDPSNIDPEVRNFLTDIICSDHINEVFPGTGEVTKLPAEVFKIIESETTKAAIKYDKAIMDIAEKYADFLNKKPESKEKAYAEDFLIEVGDFIRDGDYKAAKQKFPSISEPEFKQAQKLHKDFVFLMLLNDQIPQGD